MFVVSGASGRTGRNLASSLLARGEAVRVFLRNARHEGEWRARGAEVAIGSFDEVPAIERALDGADGFYTLLPEDPTRSDFHEHRRRMAEAIAAAVKVTRVPHVVVLSATTAYLSEGNGPGKDLHHFENKLKEASRKLTVLRACAFQENVALALMPAQRDGIYPNFLPSRDVAFPNIATKDVAEIAAGCLADRSEQSETIDLVGPAYSVNDLADRLGRALGRKLQVVDIPPPSQVETLMHAGLPRSMAEAVAELFACLASGRVSPRGTRTVAGTTELEQTLPALIEVHA